jgi:hypothetical protein
LFLGVKNVYPCPLPDSEVSSKILADPQAMSTHKLEISCDHNYILIIRREICGFLDKFYCQQPTHKCTKLFNAFAGDVREENKDALVTWTGKNFIRIKD